MDQEFNRMDIYAPEDVDCSSGLVPPGLAAIVIDPIYKVITGEENSAADMAAFCNEFDRICKQTGCCVIYCHHHSKGAQGA